MMKCAKCDNMRFGDPPPNTLCSACQKLYATATVSKEAIEASKNEKGIFVRIAEEALKSSLDNITAQVVLAAETDWQFVGASRMLEVVKRWLNTEPIKDEIWKEWEKL